MKNLLLRSVLLLLLPFLHCNSVDAKSYRGFVDLEGFYASCVGDDGCVEGFTTSHGAQVSRHFFVGGGTGFYYSVYGNVFIPIFAAARYDLFQGRKCNFFAQCRLGYRVASSHVGMGSNEQNFFLIQPSVGVRVKLGSRLGLNIGITATPFKDSEEYRVRVGNKYYDYIEETSTVIGIGLTAGIDF